MYLCSGTCTCNGTVAPFLLKKGFPPLDMDTSGSQVNRKPKKKKVFNCVCPKKPAPGEGKSQSVSKFFIFRSCCFFFFKGKSGQTRGGDVGLCNTLTETEGRGGRERGGGQRSALRSDSSVSSIQSHMLRLRHGWKSIERLLFVSPRSHAEVEESRSVRSNPTHNGHVAPR